MMHAKQVGGYAWSWSIGGCYTGQKWPSASKYSSPVAEGIYSDGHSNDLRVASKGLAGFTVAAQTYAWLLDNNTGRGSRT